MVSARLRRWVATGTVATLISLAAPLFLLWLASPGTTPAIVDAAGRPVPGALAEIRYPVIGGLAQFVLIRGRDPDAPILLLLHGGPGDAQAAMFRRYNSGLEDHFVVVHWDQRGAGASFSPEIPAETMTEERILADTHELTLWLKRRFRRSRIFLLGHSWGSYVGLRTAARHPCDYFAYVGVGQVADQKRSEAESYDFVSRRARELGNVKAVRELERIGRPQEGWYAGGLRAFATERRWVREFGGAAHGLGNRETLLLFGLPLLRFPAYTMVQKMRYLQAEAFSMNALEEAMLRFDLAGKIRRVDLPVFFFQGRYDQQTVTSVARDYFDELEAPHKEFILFEESAHLVPYEEPDRFEQVLVERVRPLRAEPPPQRCSPNPSP